MATSPVPARDDLLTIIFTSIAAYILQNILHEGLGHAVSAWLSGAHHLTLSTVALSSDIETRWISASGTLVNLLFAAIFWLLLAKRKRYKPTTHYFLVLAMAGNLFTGTGYFLFSGVTNFGDWAAVIAGLQPHWLWRLGLLLVGVPAYAASLIVVARALQPFDQAGAPPRRIRILCWTPYIAEGAFAGLAGLLNPLGWFYVVSSALASTLGANAGMWSLPGIIRRRSPPTAEQVAAIPHSFPWIISVAVSGLLFIVCLGPGLRWTR
ncbi:MAG TPA: hypothetical protein VEJ45_00585 [Candidatus Acidoferrales bacterium]|nr:hypothetical protein [Candidatus Acidoferrales bacterium]